MKILDMKGKTCPIPVIEAKKALEGMNEGETLAVLVDNAIAVQNLQKLAAQKNVSAEAETLGAAEFRVTFTVGASAAPAAETVVECAPCAAPAGEGTVVVIASDKMGEGAEELGRLLIKGYIFALSKLDILPKTILFYNSGARLTCEGSECLEDLRAMEADGVEIVTCGTCLNFYGLTDKLAVGSVGNMYQIVEAQMNAAKVLRP